MMISSAIRSTGPFPPVFGEWGPKGALWDSLPGPGWGADPYRRSLTISHFRENARFLPRFLGAVPCGAFLAIAKRRHQWQQNASHRTRQALILAVVAVVDDFRVNAEQPRDLLDDRVEYKRGEFLLVLGACLRRAAVHHDPGRLARCGVLESRHRHRARPCGRDFLDRELDAS